jgi:methyltransferase family protein
MSIPSRCQLALPADVQRALRCPICRSKIELLDERFYCTNVACGGTFPVVDRIPILINESSSVFSISDFLYRHETFFRPQQGKEAEAIRRLLPTITENIVSKRNYSKFGSLLIDKSSTPLVLVVGGSILGKGMEPLLSYPAIELVESDVSFGARTTLICDAHDLPFPPNFFDGVIIQAVLQHVADPYRCVDEIHRVLKEEGFIYAETAFMQQAVGGRYDFTRFTQLGLRRLLRKFEEIESGVACGPGTALAWAAQYFLLSFAHAGQIRRAIRLLSRLTFFPLKYFDYYLDNKPGALDAASAHYFLGQSSKKIISDQELMRLYKGAEGR